MEDSIKDPGPQFIDHMPDLRGCYLLTPGGILGAYQAKGQFVPDADLTEALAPQISSFLNEYRASRDTRWSRLGVVHPDHTDKPWKASTLAFSDNVLRRLYPVGQARDGRMTTFQLRNREQSLFRGLQLLIDYRDPALPDVHFFCPVLVYRGTTLDHYLPWPERPRQERDARTPVVEVIDLLADVARSQRTVPAAARLMESLRLTVVRPERRSASTLELIDDAQKADITPALALLDPYAGESDPQAVREFEARYVPTGFRDWDYAAWFQSHATVEIQQRLGQQLVAGVGYRHRAAEDLRCFDRLDGIGPAGLEIIAAKSPVFSVPAGILLLDRGTRDSWNLYLLSGDLELVAPDGARHALSGGDHSARQPVAFLKPRLFAVNTATQAEFLWLYEPMVEAVKRLHPGAVQGSALRR